MGIIFCSVLLTVGSGFEYLTYLWTLHNYFWTCVTLEWLRGISNVGAFRITCCCSFGSLCLPSLFSHATAINLASLPAQAFLISQSHGSANRCCVGICEGRSGSFKSIDVSGSMFFFVHSWRFAYCYQVLLSALRTSVSHLSSSYAHQPAQFILPPLLNAQYPLPPNPQCWNS